MGPIHDLPFPLLRGRGVWNNDPIYSDRSGSLKPCDDDFRVHSKELVFWWWAWWHWMTAFSLRKGVNSVGQSLHLTMFPVLLCDDDDFMVGIHWSRLFNLVVGGKGENPRCCFHGINAAGISNRDPYLGQSFKAGVKGSSFSKGLRVLAEILNPSKIILIHGLMISGTG